MKSRDKQPPRDSQNDPLMRILDGEEKTGATNEERELATMVELMNTLGEKSDGLPDSKLSRAWNRVSLRIAENEDSKPSVFEKVRRAVSPANLVRFSMACTLIAVAWLGFEFFTQEGPVATLVFTGDRIQAGEHYRSGGIQDLELVCHTELTTADAGAIVRYHSGVQVMLASQTLAKVVENRDLELSRGSVWIEVAKGNGEFFVKTPDLVVRVTGTSFGVAHDASGSRVVLTQGAVEVASASAPENVIRLAPGQSVSVATSSSSLGPVENSADIPIWVGRLYSEAVAASVDPLVPSVTVDSETLETPSR